VADPIYEHKGLNPERLYNPCSFRPDTICIGSEIRQMKIDVTLPADLLNIDVKTLTGLWPW
jgi:hypothetical protein